MQIEEHELETGFGRQDKYIHMGKANIYGILVTLPILAAELLLYFLKKEEVVFELLPLLISFALFIVGIALHELIHGIFFAVFCQHGFRSIRFGIMKGSPYCHCKELLKPYQYRIALIMPFILTAVLPFVLALFVNGIASLMLFLLSLLLTIGAGGDLLVFLIILKLPSGAYVKDHPSECGCQVFVPQNRL